MPLHFGMRAQHAITCAVSSWLPSSTRSLPDRHALQDRQQACHRHQVMCLAATISGTMQDTWGSKPPGAAGLR